MFRLGLDESNSPIGKYRQSIDHCYMTQDSVAWVERNFGLPNFVLNNSEYFETEVSLNGSGSVFRTKVKFIGNFRYFHKNVVSFSNYFLSLFLFFEISKMIVLMVIIGHSLQGNPMFSQQCEDITPLKRMEFDLLNERKQMDEAVQRKKMYKYLCESTPIAMVTFFNDNTHSNAIIKGSYGDD